ncbi:MAG: cytochrome c [Acidobacteriia bacterium]|nr:cytochrome c [Terriglobia bacterium]
MQPLPLTPRCLPRITIAFCVAALPLAFFFLAAAHAHGPAKTLPIYTVNGAEIFRDYCAACHGIDGKGNGPVAPALKYKVPDLTEISKRGNGKFPIARIRDIIDGKETLSGHGSREMPVWGPIFHQVDADQDLGNVRIDNLARYIESLQRK